MNADLLTKPDQGSYKSNKEGIKEMAKEQKAHNFKMTYDESNGIVDDVKAQPKIVKVSFFKPKSVLGKRNQRP